MGWQDKPTKNQTGTIKSWLWECMPGEKARAAEAWIAEHANRQEVSTEMHRLYTLRKEKKLDSDSCFESPIWNGFGFECDEHPTEKQISHLNLLLMKSLPMTKTIPAVAWFAKNATKKQASGEISRIEGLLERYALTEEEAFNADVWADYFKEKGE